VAVVSQTTLATAIFDLHAFVADVTALKRLELDKDQATALAKAVAGVNEHLKLPVLSSRNAALLMLFWTAGRIYVPMARDVMAGQVAKPSQAAGPVSVPVNTSQPETQGMAGSIVLPADDAAVEEWLPKLH